MISVRALKGAIVSLIVLGGMLGWLGGLSTVGAHASLVSSDPTPDARLREAPRTITLNFSQGLKPAGSWVQIEDSGANRLPISAEFDPADLRVMRASLPALSADVYSVRWQTLSADDDDYNDGTFEFMVLQADGSLPAAAVTASPEANQRPPAKTSEGSSGLGVVLASLTAVAMVGGALFYVTRSRRTS